MIIKNTIFLHLSLILILLITFSCKDNENYNSENMRKVREMYKSGERIKPLPEYTAKNPREWEEVADEHVPQLRKARLRGEDAVLITVPFEKVTMQHYVEKIGILDENGKEIISISFERLPNQKSYAHFAFSALPRDRKLKAYAKCNLHDMWTVELDIDDLE